MKLVYGFLLGGGWAIVDTLVLYGMTRRAKSAPQEERETLLWKMMAARYLLGFAAVAVGLLSPMLNPLGVIVPMLVQKAVLVAGAMIHKN